MACTIRSNKVVREVELAERRMLLDCLADGNAASHHSSIVGEVEDEQVSFVVQHACDGECAFLSDGAISQMQVGKCLIVLNALRKKCGSF